MNGSQPFVYLWTCGCVFSQAGLRAVSGTPPPRDNVGDSEHESKGVEDPSSGKQLDVCPQCATKYDKTRDIMLLNPPPEEEEKMHTAMLIRRASEPVKTKSKKRKAGSPPDQAQPPSKKLPVPSINSSIATASRAVAQDLAEEEARRRAHMSDAVKSLYTSKDGPKRKETFMTMGTFTRVRHPDNLLTFRHANLQTVRMSMRKFCFGGSDILCIDIVYHYLNLTFPMAFTIWNAGSPWHYACQAPYTQ